MKIVLRCIAAWNGSIAVALPLALAVLAGTGNLSATTSRERLVLGALMAFPLASGFAAVQLWRLRESGRLASVGTVCLGSLIGFLQDRTLTLTPLVFIRSVIELSVVLVLLSSAAQRECGAPHI